MKTIKLAIVALVAATAIAAMVPGAALAAHASKGHPSQHSGVIFGSLSNYMVAATTTGTITTPAGDVANFTLGKKAKLVSEDGSAAPANADNVAAWVGWHKGAATVRRLEFGVNPFAVGRNYGFNGTCSAVTLNPDSSLSAFTITFGKGQAKSATYNVDTSTKYFEKGKAAPDTAVASGERLNGRAKEFTNGSWFASIVRIRAAKHKK